MLCLKGGQTTQPRSLLRALDSIGCTSGAPSTTSACPSCTWITLLGDLIKCFLQSTRCMCLQSEIPNHSVYVGTLVVQVRMHVSLSPLVFINRCFWNSQLRIQIKSSTMKVARQGTRRIRRIDHITHTSELRTLLNESDEQDSRVWLITENWFVALLGPCNSPAVWHRVTEIVVLLLIFLVAAR